MDRNTLVNNPKAHVARVLGITKVEFVARRTELETYLSSKEDKQEIDENVARAALTVAVSDQLWNELKKIVGIG